MGTRTLSSIALAGAALLALACGKRAYVPQDAAPAASSAAVALPSPAAATCPGVALAIVSVRNGGGYVTAVVELRNDSAGQVPLMLTGDGSSAGRRNPTLTFELAPNDVAPQMGCGNMNGLSASEIVSLAPGEHMKLGWVSPPTPSKAGRYTLRATYRNDPTSNDLGDNREGPETDRLIALVRKTRACTLVSNSMSFTWP